MRTRTPLSENAREVTFDLFFSHYIDQIRQKTLTSYTVVLALSVVTLGMSILFQDPTDDRWKAGLGLLIVELLLKLISFVMIVVWFWNTRDPDWARNTPADQMREYTPFAYYNKPVIFSIMILLLIMAMSSVVRMSLSLARNVTSLVQLPGVMEKESTQKRVQHELQIYQRKVQVALSIVFLTLSTVDFIRTTHRLTFHKGVAAPYIPGHLMFGV